LFKKRNDPDTASAFPNEFHEIPPDAISKEQYQAPEIAWKGTPMEYGSFNYNAPALLNDDASSGQERE
jgi:hypothetical protein